MKNGKPGSHQTDYQFRQTTLWEFIDRKYPSNEGNNDNHDHGDKGIRPTTRINLRRGDST
jgi:hypothetical protein